MALSVNASDTFYWVGGNGSWHNPASWSLTPSGAPGAGVPDATTNVVFGNQAEVTASAPLSFHSLVIQDGASVGLFSTHTVNLYGDLTNQGSFSLEAPAMYVMPGIHHVTGNTRFLTNIALQDGALLNLHDHLNLNGFTFDLSNAALNANGYAIHCGSFFAAEAADANLVGAIIVASDTVSIHPNARVQQSDPVIWPVEGASIDPGPAEVNFQRTNTCGNGPGQTPFTIDAVVASNYNGEDVSCNGAADGVATVTVVGGVGTFSYQWIGGNSPGFLQTYTGLEAGTYTVLVTDLGQGITCVDNVQLTEPSPLTVFDFTFTPPSCAGECNGSGTPITIGGVPGYTFNWGNGEITQTAFSLCEGLTTLEITDQNNCAFDTSFTVELVPIIANVSVTDVLCNGEASGEASAAPSGGAGGPYTISWSNGENGPFAENLTAGSYTVTITDNGGCDYDTTFTVNELPPIEITLDNSTNASCFGAADGEISISISGGQAPITTDWTGPGAFTSSDEDLTGLQAGDYTVFVTDDNGCEAVFPVSIGEPAEITVDASVSDIDCFGELSGAISITVNNAAAPFTTEWTGPGGFNSSDEDLTGLEAGSYDLTVTDAGGCVVQFTYTISEPSQLDINSFITDVSCNGSADGAIDLNPSGGTAPYTFVWSGPGGFSSNAEDISNLAPGFYELIVNDNEGCVNPFTFEVLDADPIDISTDLTPISCNGANDGSVNIFASGGSPPYTYSWTGPGGFTSSDEDLTNLAPGTYDLVLTDDQGCVEQASVVINEPDPLTLVLTPSDVSCGGFADGEIELSILGGTPTYTQVWNGPNSFTSTDEDLTGLEAGDYTVDVTDLEGCTTSQSVTIDEVPELVADLTVTQISCNGSNDGAIDMEIVGGQPPYTIDWAGPNLFTSNDEDLTGLEPGLYNVLIVDANDCFFETAAEITEPDPLDTELITVDPTCAGAANGAITLNVSGGTPPYTINWDNGQVGPSLSGLPAGSYTATITDDAGCVTVMPAALLEDPNPIAIDLSSTPTLCNGDNNATIDAEVGGGVPPFTLNWSGPDGFTSTDEDLTNLAPGTYTLEVTDNDGCSVSESITIDEPQPLDAQVVVTALLCSDDLADVDLTISGGTAPYSVIWVGPNAFTSNNEDLVQVEQGSYDLQVEDANGCIFVGNYTVSAPNALTLSADTSPLDCTGDPVGAIDLTITGGTSPFTINWVGPAGFSSNDEDLSALQAGSYEVEVIDDNGCVQNLSVVLDEVDPIIVDATVEEPLCNGENTGAIAITITGGVDPYSVSWTGPDGFSSSAEDISNLSAGDYEGTITDAEGCTATVSVQLNEPDEITLDAAITDVLCAGEATGAIDLTVSGGVGPYLYVWSAPGFTSDQEDISNLQAGNYQIDVQDDNGCTAQAVFSVAENAPVEVSLDITNSTCNESNGSVTATATGGTAPLDTGFLDEDMNPLATGTTLNNLGAGNYFFAVSDANGCITTEAFSISDSDAIQLEADATSPLCNGDTNGTIDLTVTGGTGTVTITWSGPDGFSSSDEDLSDLAAGSYTAEAVDELGCVSSITVDLDEPQELGVNAVVTDVSCGSTDDGAVDISLSGGTGPFSYEWTGPDGFVSSDEDISNLIPGTYELTVTDAGLCVVTAQFEVGQQLTVDADFMITDIDCAGESTGSISVNVLSGEAPYDFTWTGPEGFSSENSDIAGVGAGTYNLVLQDNLGCVLDTNLTVSEGDPIELSIDQVQPSCQSSDGSLEAIATGGTVMTDYTYFWYDLDNGNALIGNTALVENLSSGSYFIEVFDDLGCTVSQTVTLADNAGDLEAVMTSPLCNGDANGTIDLTVNGFNPPYTYSWSGPNGFSSTDEDVADLAAGEYTVEVTDALGCLLIDAFTLDEPEALTADVTAGDALCADQNNGVAQAAIAGGTTPYVISWTGPDGYAASDAMIADLAPGCYQLTVTDANGCQVNGEACVNAPAAIEIEAVTTSIDCFGAATGSIDLTASGGAGGFTYIWSGPNGFSADTEDLAGLISGGYTVTVTDANMCSRDSLFVLSQNPQIVANADTLHPTCNGFNDGSVTLAPSGGVGPYTVEWNDENGPVGSDPALNDLGAGVYEYTITDALGCSIQGSIELVEPDPLSSNVTQQHVLCAGDDNGTLTVDPSGGTAPYSIFWVGPNGFSSTALQLADLAPGSYELTIGDANGCTLTETLEINEPLPLTVSLDEVQQTSCLDSEDGSISVTVEGGTEPFTFTWSNDNGDTFADEDLTDVATGNYSLVVTDANGCTGELPMIPLGFGGDVTADAGMDEGACFGEAIELFGTNTGADTEGWETIDGEPLADGPTYIVNEEPGEYIFVYSATDNTCTDTDTVIVNVFDLPTADAGLDQDVFFDEAATLGGNPTSEEGNLIIWIPEDHLTETDVANPETRPLTESQWFYLEVIDLNGCTAEDSVFVNVIPEIEVVSGFTPNGDGMNELWTIGNHEMYPSLSVEVYNRWGERLYLSENGYARPWDGTFNGNPLPIGTYYYVISIDEPQYKTTLTGPVTILR